MTRILVTGATGNVGRHLVTELAASGCAVRRATRQGSTGASTGAESGTDLVDTVRFDFTDPSTWAAAYDDVTAMFLVRPPEMGRVRRDLVPALEAARDAGVRHVVLLSLQGAERNRVVPHARLESWLRGSGLAWTFVRPSFFVTNLVVIHAADIRDRDSLTVPAGQSRTSFVDVRDVAAVAAAALRDPAGHIGRAWTVTGPRAATYGEVAALLSAELGRRIRYTAPGLGAYLRRGRRTGSMPLGLAVVSGAIYTTARLGLAAGVTDHVQRVLGRPPIPLARSLHLERSAWLRDEIPTHHSAQEVPR